MIGTLIIAALIACTIGWLWSIPAVMEAGPGRIITATLVAVTTVALVTLTAVTAIEAWGRP